MIVTASGGSVLNYMYTGIFNVRVNSETGDDTRCIFEDRFPCKTLDWAQRHFGSAIVVPFYTEHLQPDIVIESVSPHLHPCSASCRAVSQRSRSLVVVQGSTVGAPADFIGSGRIMSSAAFKGSHLPPIFGR